MTLTNPGLSVPSPPESVIEGLRSNSGSRLSTNPQPPNTAPESATTVISTDHSDPNDCKDEVVPVLLPYLFENAENNPSPPPEVIQLWIDVGNGIDKSQTGES